MAAEAAGAAWLDAPPYGGQGPFRAKYSAACFCKRVRFEVSADPEVAKICECTICMRLHGAPMLWAALLDPGAVRFKPESAAFLRFYNSALDAAYEDGASKVLPVKIRCGHCGTPVGEEHDGLFIGFPTLFEFVNGERPTFPKSFTPRCRIFCGTRALEVNDGLPSFLDDCATPLSIGDFLRDIAPRLDGGSYKGQSGRIGLLGGSVDFAGAPYYAGMAALRVGAELLYLCTAEEAAGPIKTYSPELMVSSVYRWSHMSSETAEVRTKEQDGLVAKVAALLPRFHALVIGCGLGRDDGVLAAVARVITEARERKLPLVIDADGLWLIERRPELVRGYEEAVLTPNAAELRRLAKAVLGDEAADPAALCRELRGPILVRKGATDLICSPGAERPLECAEEGCPRRPGGLGDFLAGGMGVLVAWAALRGQSKAVACQAACTVVRRACRRAYAKRLRSMTAPDVLEEVGAAFEELCPAPPSAAAGCGDARAD